MDKPAIRKSLGNLRSSAGMRSVWSGTALTPIPSYVITSILRGLSEIPCSPGGIPSLMGACDTHSQSPDAAMVCIAC